MANPYPSATDFEKLLSARTAPPAAGYTMNPIQQREAMLKNATEKEKAELLAKAVGSSDERIVDGWLRIKNVKGY